MKASTIRAELARKRIKQRVIAAMLGWSEVKVSRLLNGVRRNPDDLKRIAECLK